MKGDRTNYGQGAQMIRLELRLTLHEVRILRSEAVDIRESLQDVIRRLIRNQDWEG